MDIYWLSTGPMAAPLDLHGTTSVPYSNFISTYASWHEDFLLNPSYDVVEGSLEVSPGFDAISNELGKLVEGVGESGGTNGTTSREMNCGCESKMPNLDDYVSRNGGCDSKRMKVGGAGRRIGFRMISEVEIIDDGFKWRKYGKKSVKNSPYLRNYYKCSSEGCGVKKRAERDDDDPKYVITTYEGVHNHPSPGTFSYSYTPEPAWFAHAKLPFMPERNAWATMQNN